MRKIIIYLSVIIFTISCKDKKLKNINNSKINLDKIQAERDYNFKKTKESDSLKILLKNIDKIKILDFEKGFMETSLPDSLVCTKWLIKKIDLNSIIKKTKQIDSSDLHYLFETQTCIYSGNFELDGIIYSFGINSGGWLHIQYGDIVLGCFDKECEDFFLGKVDKPKEEFKNDK